MLIDILKLVRYYLEALISRPLFFLLPMLLVLTGGAYFVYQSKPNYYSEAFLLLEFQHMATSLLSPTVSNDRLQFIEERVFAKDRLISLADDFHLFPEAVTSKLSRTQLATLVRSKIVLRTAVTEGTGDFASTASVRIGFNASDANVAAAVTSKLVEMIVAENRRMRTSRATEATQFFAQEVDKISANLRTREAAWTAYREANKLIQPSRITALLAELQSKEEDLVTVNQARLVLDEEVKLMEGQLRLRSGESSEAGAIRTQLAALRTEITEKSLIYSDTHPSIRLLKQKYQELEAQAARASNEPSSAANATLSPELTLIAERIANAKPRQEASRALTTELVARIDWLKEVVARAPEVESKLAEIQTEKQAIERNLADMQSKLDAARMGERLEMDSAMSKIEVVETPEVPPLKTGPSRKVMLMVLAAFSVLAGAAGVFLADSLDRKIRGSFDLADALEGEELIMIPNWTPRFGVRRWFGLLPSRDSMTTSRA